MITIHTANSSYLYELEKPMDFEGAVEILNSKFRPFPIYTTEGLTVFRPGSIMGFELSDRCT